VDFDDSWESVFKCDQLASSDIMVFVRNTRCSFITMRWHICTAAPLKWKTGVENMPTGSAALEPAVAPNNDLTQRCLYVLVADWADRTLLPPDTEVPRRRPLPSHHHRLFSLSCSTSPTSPWQSFPGPHITTRWRFAGVLESQDLGVEDQCAFPNSSYPTR
jgi:hypothetical protein